ncbi:glycosyltransferase [Rosenbergiella epipactidis]|uniref:glycosyltransferase n=1 Tax=Rosenbergiella epipactidis TaxID=1544694 RepID=UPI001BDA32DB|nr:glycosyltransferase [Rosenbergiella epipactidis]MBT0718285.1 glycosyltransferase [Rosenbergiella epipactidis]
MISNKNQPDITVYIITKNRLNLLKRCVNSILEQDFSDFEIIIVDDASTDKTPDYLKELEINNVKVRCFFNDVSRGACYSRNIAIQAAKGKYITGSDDDDYFLPNRLSVFFGKRHLLDDYIFLHSHNLFLTKSGMKKSIPNMLSPKVITHRHLLSYNSIGNQVFTKTDVLKKYLFNELLPAWQDFEIWYRIMFNENRHSIYLENYSYIQDVLHDSIRISDSKLSRILSAMEIFKNNNDLNDLELNVLSNHLRSYENNSKLRKESLIALAKYFPNLFNIFLIAFYTLKFIFNKFR